MFELRKDGMYLKEVALGVDIEKDIYRLMGFRPKAEGAVKLMDTRVFTDELMNL